MNSVQQPKKVIVGMSGGVDSSVAALLLKQQGYQVEGLFMKNWNEDDGTEYCTALTDLADALAVCKTLDIKLHSVNFSTEYWDRVFEHFLEEYRSGRTPNPDILCNKEIKFKAFLDHALEMGADYIATGHYVRKRNAGNATELLKGLDPDKDQSYFLHAVSGDKIAKTLFPVGELPKAEVRAIAHSHGLVTHDKKDSTGICFIGERKFSDFLKTYIPAQPGNILTDQGEIIGKHQGLMYYTIGQRQGLKIGGLKHHGDAPWYVIEKKLEENELIVAQNGQNPKLFKNALTAIKLDWVNDAPDQPVLHCAAKIRYRHEEQSCQLYKEADHYRVEFDTPQRAVTPGQSVVFYKGETCLGGGVIESAWNR